MGAGVCAKHIIFMRHTRTKTPPVNIDNHVFPCYNYVLPIRPRAKEGDE